MEQSDIEVAKRSGRTLSISQAANMVFDDDDNASDLEDLDDSDVDKTYEPNSMSISSETGKFNRHLLYLSQVKFEIQRSDTQGVMKLPLPSISTNYRIIKVMG